MTSDFKWSPLKTCCTNWDHCAFHFKVLIVWNFIFRIKSSWKLFYQHMKLCIFELEQFSDSWSLTALVSNHLKVSRNAPFIVTTRHLLPSTMNTFVISTWQLTISQIFSAIDTLSILQNAFSFFSSSDSSRASWYWSFLKNMFQCIKFEIYEKLKTFSKRRKLNESKLHIKAFEGLAKVKWENRLKWYFYATILMSIKTWNHNLH